MTKDLYFSGYLRSILLLNQWNKNPRVIEHGVFCSSWVADHAWFTSLVLQWRRTVVFGLGMSDTLFLSPPSLPVSWMSMKTEILLDCLQKSVWDTSDGNSSPFLSAAAPKHLLFLLRLLLKQMGWRRCHVDIELLLRTWKQILSLCRIL